MNRYARMFLHFLHAITNDRDRVHTLRLRHAADQHHAAAAAPRRRRRHGARGRRQVQDWSGGTRIGACLREFNRRWARRVLGQNACVLLVTDGLDRDGAARGWARRWSACTSPARTLIWLNPLLRYDGFEAKPAGVRAMLPHVDRFLPVHNLESLVDLARTLRQPPARHTGGSGMEMTGEERIPAPQSRTWAALNDPEILKACVPGCESIDPVAENEYQVLMVARVGPVSARFKGKLTLSDIKAPESYSIAFEGQGGAAGFGKGSARVQLAPDGEGTLLRYDVKANVGGKLAQIGSRLVDAAARKIAEDFFAAFNEKVAAQQGSAHGHGDLHGPADEHTPEPVPRDPDLPTVSNASLIFLAAGVLVVFVVALVVLLG